MTNIKTDKYFVLSIARADFVRNYPSKYQRDTKEHYSGPQNLDNSIRWLPVTERSR